MTEQEMEALAKDLLATLEKGLKYPWIHVLAAFKRVAANERDWIAKDLDGYFGNGHDDEFLVLILDRIKKVPR